MCDLLMKRQNQFLKITEEVNLPTVTARDWSIRLWMKPEI